MNINELYGALGQAGVIAVLAAFGMILFRRSVRPVWLVAALAIYLGYDFALTRAYFALDNYPVGSAWNWTGKALGIGFTLAVAALPWFGWRRCGLTLRQAKGSWTAWAALGVLTAVLAYFAATDGTPPSDAETIAFQWTMPGFDEEPFYRGVLLLAMNEAFARKVRVLGAPIGYGGLLTSVLFGLVHAMSYGASGFAFDPMTFAVTGVPSLILLWMRERTGSLVVPVLAHNVANGIFNVL